MTSDLQRFALPTPAFVKSDKSVGEPDSKNVLGAITYASQYQEPHRLDGHPNLTVHMVDDAVASFSEVWYTDRAVKHGEVDNVVYSHDGEQFFCAARIDGSNGYTDTIRDAYRTALGLTRALGYERLFRMWNFVQDINLDNRLGLEIYRDFCRGRAQAFDELNIPDKHLPAATGIGSLGGGVAFCLLGSRSAQCVNIENTRQVPAYRYPRRYGPRSPSFARATHLTSGGSGHIYVSGTASIVGHETVHLGDVQRQTREALANIQHLISAENLAGAGLLYGRTLADLRNVKVYVRHRQDIPAVRAVCNDLLGPEAEIAYFNVDICRKDLLVEIEGVVLN